MSFISGFFGGVIGYIGYIAVYIVTMLATVIITLITYLIGVVLQLSNNIPNTFAVQRGFLVTLSIANLGFVLAIIIIALATILKRETYGIKKSLWKLVVAAILVNFSLVIGSVFINFSNAFTNTFLDQLPAVNGSHGAMAFSQELAGAFQPQRALLNFSTGSQSSVTNTGSMTAGAPKTVSAGSEIAAVIQPLIGAAAAAALLVTIIIVLAVFLFMLLIRYVWLAMLLILMPFAWLMWLFPKTSKIWSDWWNQFFRWTFFAPIVVFFLWLAIATAQGMNAGTANGNFIASGDLSYLSGTEYQPTSSNPVLAGLSKTFGDFVGGIAGTFLQGILVVGLAVGGMYAANKFSITGASAGMAALKSVGNAAKGYAGRESKKGLRWAYQHGRIPGTNATGQSVTNRLMQSRIPLASTAGRAISGLAAKGGKDLVKDAASTMKLADMTDDNLVLTAKGARGHDSTLAVLAEAQKRGKLAKLKEVGGEKDLATYLQKNEQVFSDYEHGKLKSDVDTALGSNNQMRSVARIMGAAAAPSQMMEDRYGIVGPAGNMVPAETLLGGSRVVMRNAQEAIDDIGPTATISHNGRNVVVQDLLNQAKETAQHSEDVATGGGALVSDQKGLLGAVGNMVKAGELMRAAAEDFYKDKDKGDISKVRVGELFGGTSNFGLDKTSMDALSRAATHGIALRAPSLVSSIANKLDNSQKLEDFMSKYESSVENAFEAGKINSVAKKKMLDASDKLRQGVLLGYTPMETGAAAPASGAPPAGTP